jgi:hypothetical protein
LLCFTQGHWFLLQVAAKLAAQLSDSLTSLVAAEKLNGIQASHLNHNLNFKQISNEPQNRIKNTFFTVSYFLISIPSK